MVNTVMLVGRLVQDPEIRTTESDKDILHITVAVNRSFKNPDGIYETDFIDCTLWDGLAKNLSEYCKKGDTVGIRGRIQVGHYEKDGVKMKKVLVVAERVTFLGSSRSADTTTSDNDINNDPKHKKDKNTKN